MVALCAELGDAVARLEAANVVKLIPEIGAGFAYAAPDAQTLADVAGLAGRMLAFEGRVTHLGGPALGASVTMGGTLLEIRRFFPQARCVTNLRNHPGVREALSGLGWNVAVMPPTPDFRQTHEDYVRDLRATLGRCQELPDVIDLPDRINLERLILMIGTSLDEAVDKIITLSRRLG